MLSSERTRVAVTPQNITMWPVRDDVFQDTYEKVAA